MPPASPGAAPPHDRWSEPSTDWAAVRLDRFVPNADRLAASKCGPQHLSKRPHFCTCIQTRIEPYVSRAPQLAEPARLSFLTLLIRWALIGLVRTSLPAEALEICEFLVTPFSARTQHFDTSVD